VFVNAAFEPLAQGEGVGFPVPQQGAILLGRAAPNDDSNGRLAGQDYMKAGRRGIAHIVF